MNDVRNIPSRVLVPGPDGQPGGVVCALRPPTGFARAGRVFAHLALVLIAVCLFAAVAFAHPEMVRHNYPTCGACHVSPAGGGALSNYGRALSEEMSTWAAEGEGNPFYGAGSMPEWLALGSSVRYLNVNSAGYHRKFWMQREAELAVNPLPGLTIATTYGAYGADGKREMRRNYVMAENGGVSLRAGRFIPSYGITTADHTTPTRARLGLGEGAETYNAELGVTTKWGQVFATAVFGNELDLNMSDGSGYDYYPSNEMTGAVGRAVAFLAPSVQAGVSYMGLSNFEHWRQAYGGHAAIGMGHRVWALVEGDRKFEDGARLDVAMARVGVEAYRGLHLIAHGSLVSKDYTRGAAVQWFPRPHFELLAEWRRERGVNGWVFLFHHYL